ncbi:MAG: hypothetical protein V3S33_00870, partial [Gammaproteobacteria bacterium]
GEEYPLLTLAALGLLHYPVSLRHLRRAGYSSPLSSTVVNTAKLTHYRFSKRFPELPHPLLVYNRTPFEAGSL